MSSPRNSYIAVIDDEESICRSLGRLLRAAGFQPITYLSAQAFLDDERGPHFDCLLSDIQLGGMSGIELKLRLNELHSVTPMIFITAHDDPEIRQRAMESGCAGYFHKTAPGAEILAAIDRAISAAEPGKGQ